MEPVARGFDSFASCYAHAFESNDLASWARDRAQRFYSEFLPLKGTVADLGCGPGIDSVYLAGRGTRVVGIDISAGMVDQARSAAQLAGVADFVRFDIADIRNSAALQGAFPDPANAAILGFGVLNDCVALGPLLRSIDRILAPKSPVILSSLSRMAVWDSAWNIFRGSWPRRWGHQPRPAHLGTYEIFVSYWTLGELLGAVKSAGWNVKSIRGVGVVAPPPYLDGKVPRLLSRALCSADERIGKTFMAGLADMVWVCAETGGSRPKRDEE